MASEVDVPSAQTAMRCRVTPTARQLRAAELMIVDGASAKAALLAVGYSKWTARIPGQFIRNSKGMRAAIALVQERTCCYLTRPAPPRKRRYDRRPTAKMVEKYVLPTAAEETSNQGPNLYHEQERRARAAAEGRPMPKPQQRGPQMVLCQHCGNLVKKSEYGLNASLNRYVGNCCRYT